MKSTTAKGLVLRKYPKAYARYLGLSRKFVVVADHGGPDLSAYRLRERDAWTDAARKLRGSFRTVEAEMKQPTQLKFKPGEKRKDGIVRVQIKATDAGLLYRKWNYNTRRWGRWEAYE